MVVLVSTPCTTLVVTARAEEDLIAGRESNGAIGLREGRERLYLEKKKKEEEEARVPLVSDDDDTIGEILRL